jgi:hypothetical protein
MRRPPIVTHVRRLGPTTIGGELRRRLASEEVNFGLRCELERLPPLKQARIPLTLGRCDGSFNGFRVELERTSGADYGRVLRRQKLHAQALPSMYVALNAEAAPVYVQWLMTSADQITFGDSSQLWFPLKPDEVLLEFAYTFTPFRGFGVMGDAMGRLLRVAAQSGARWARTYVSDDNIPSLRGCSKVGFELDHVRTTTNRLGTVRNRFAAPAEGDRQRWEQATVARASA